MRAVTWQGKRKVSVDEVPDPALVEPTDAIIKITTTNICGSDLHLYETPLERAPEMYETFQNKQDGCVKVLLKPAS